MVSVWLRVPAECEVDGRPRAHGRSTASRQFVPATVDARRTDGTDTWWRARLTCHNPVTGYRWILDGRPTGYAWLNGTGLHLRDVPDAGDFRLVAHDLRRRTGRWTRSSTRSSRTGSPSLAGAAERRDRVPDWAVPARWTDPVTPFAARTRAAALRRRPRRDHRPPRPLERLGADVLYLTPFFPARSNHRYDASTFGAGRPGARGRRGAAPAHRRGPPTGHAGPRRLHDQPHRRQPRVVRRRARPSESSPERGLLLLDDAGRLRRLARGDVAAQAQLRQRRAAPSVLRRPGRSGPAVAGSARAAWTDGGSTSPT